MGRKIKDYLHNIMFRIFAKLIPELKLLKGRKIHWDYLMSEYSDSKVDNLARIQPPYSIIKTEIGEGTYIAFNSVISITKIGKFCSIGPNFFCGWGIHPTNGLSTSPMFYSTLKQNGRTLSPNDKIEERKLIRIGNDVFIGANVTILDGVNIGDGAIIGAGAVVSKDIPPYAIAVGCPINIIRYRFPQVDIDKLLKIKWWNFEENKLKEVERYFFDIDTFLGKYYKEL
jgi:acetyltransferase-like isoleucine patch superfamily enzyme